MMGSMAWSWSPGKLVIRQVQQHYHPSSPPPLVAPLAINPPLGLWTNELDGRPDVVVAILRTVFTHFTYSLCPGWS